MDASFHGENLDQTLRVRLRFFCLQVRRLRPPVGGRDRSMVFALLIEIG